MAGVFWHDGKWLTEEPKVLGPMDHAFWLGSILFDGARAIRGLVPDLDLHCQRVIRSAHAMGMKPTLSAEAIEELCREGVRRMGPDAELYIRPMFFVRRGIGAAQPDGDSTEFILSIYDSPMPDVSKGFSACMVPFRRPAADMAPTDAKASCLYPNSSRAAGWAREHGYDNAVMSDFEGNVAEFATSNLMMVKDGVVMTPIANGTYLAGITRSRVLGLLREAGIEARECVITPDMLRGADEIFATGNFGKVQYCTNFEGRQLPIGPVAQKARQLYFDWAERTSRLLPKAA
ncbi:branched-chain amino acid aminotransferase [Teichococcus cervicalis]|uniref:Probable branched-chain-amino-acid aminotransferase n=1 Tax=Pseudoroseomonas cervicalis ATCC 49957 TaxID=525371 RepID=D5RLB8_9PROT|nr:branched-chain amino acid aminotransferase [Pseudoroseomonas cervicalis]EFH11905.1 aminotransferase, class IV [Pseudoroseomonas cervicalis ATCC 49957]